MIVNVDELFQEFSNIPQVEAIALGGSRATGRHDEKSDYDVYIYLTDSVEENIRRSILENISPVISDMVEEIKNVCISCSNR